MKEKIKIIEGILEGINRGVVFLIEAKDGKLYSSVTNTGISAEDVERCLESNIIQQKERLQKEEHKKITINLPILPKGKKILLIDMHNNTKYAIKIIKKYIGNTKYHLLTTQISLDIFLKTASKKEIIYWESVRDKIQVNPTIDFAKILGLPTSTGTELKGKIEGDTFNLS